MEFLSVRTQSLASMMQTSDLDERTSQSSIMYQSRRQNQNMKDLMTRSQKVEPIRKPCFRKLIENISE